MEILHHLGCTKPCKWLDVYHINWCRISAINSIIVIVSHQKFHIPWMVFIRSHLRCECHVGPFLRNVVVTNPGLDPWGEAFYKCVAWSHWMRCRSCCWCSCCDCGPVGDQQMEQPNSVIRLKLLSVIRKSKEGVKGLALNGTNPVPPCFGTLSADPSKLLIAWERHKSS